MHTITLDTAEKKALDFVLSCSREAADYITPLCKQDGDSFSVTLTDDDVNDLLDLLDEIKNELDVAAETDEDAFYALEDLLYITLEDKEN